MTLLYPFINKYAVIIERLLWFLILSSPIVFSIQCGDLTDAGFYATNYFFFFDDLKHGQTNSISFLTDLIGAIWFKLFPSLGVFGLKILYTLSYYGNVFLVFKILSKISTNKILILLGLFTAVFFSQRYVNYIFGRDECSWLFLVISAYFIFEAMQENKISYFFIAGIFCALASLSRFPALVFVFLLPMLLFYKHLYKNQSINSISWKRIFTEYLQFIIGFVLTIIIFIGVLNVFGYDKDFLQNYDILDTGKQSSYSLSSLFQSYILNLLSWLPHLIVVPCFMLLAGIVFEYTHPRFQLVFVIVFLFVTLIIRHFIYFELSYGSPVMYIMPSICFFPLLLSLIKKDRFAPYVLLFIFLAFSQVIGSNTGLFMKLGTGFVFLFPLTLFILTEYKTISIGTFKQHTRFLILSSVLVLFIFSFFCRFGFVYHVSRGLRSRFKTIYPINHPAMKVLLTDKNRARFIPLLTNEIKRTIRPNNTLFIFGHQPMFYYLTQKKPAVRKYWLVNKFVEPEELFANLNNQIIKTGRWPLMVDMRQNVMFEKGEVLLNEFLTKNHYNLLVDSPHYRIWHK